MAKFQDQEYLLRGLAVLQAMDYADPSALLSNKPGRTNVINSRLRLLDVIAAGLATGSSGDVVAAAFSGREVYMQQHGPIDSSKAKTFVLLAKNETPSIRDKHAATKLFDAINDPKTEDLFPILLERCKENMQKRVTSLLKILREPGFLKFMQSELHKYQPHIVVGSNQFVINKEFENPGPILPALVKEYAPKDFEAFWKALIQAIEINGAIFSKAKEEKKLREAYETISLIGYSIQYSTFLNQKLLIKSQYKERTEKFKRRLSKINVYTRGARYLLEQADKIRPVKCFWVENEPSDTRVEYGPFNPVFKDEVQEILKEMRLRQGEKPSIVPSSSQYESKWKKIITDECGQPKKLRAYFHCEVKIMHYMEQKFMSRNVVKIATTSSNKTNERFQGEGYARLGTVAIGVSKNSCLMCQWSLDRHNDMKFERNYVTSGNHGKPYAKWFNLPGTEYAEHARLLVEKLVKDALTTSPGKQRNKQRVVSDEHYSSSDDDRRTKESGEDKITAERYAKTIAQQIR
ncbi:hypothetical protein AGABI1DRAFT_93977 [Agaricus bisporus var. burnettii JB137-S8]|uniref:Uncharacterized protein n=1 Tax=Agaricus bisporus var. burnettii (strain JB137-S8 / ATCC MYA-4627 / FGSC 10392) TaxID=597362 RepID=K5WML2_AGABU|nr:uncharacterized protein AGABI1DRAFT_93977 [Agaricus bisporus var. burnettii JB137-S8]EKM76551.1 hypothetical protein AGABI1DRAFT_93977 [Agaricus bisporus var. burnettii JB137-S8]